MIKETPMMRQWSQIKRQQPDAIVLFRLGDFYEAFNEDARQLAEVCDVTLTSRPVAKGERAPMAGVPYHAVDGYIAQLVRHGLKVAIVEQLGAESSPEKRARMSRVEAGGGGASGGGLAAADGTTVPSSGAKGIMAREVVRVVTPGTLIEGDLIDARAPNYLAALAWTAEGVGLAHADVTTGEFATTDFTGPDAERRLVDELVRLRPAELLVAQSTAGDVDPRVAGLRSTFDQLGLPTVVMPYAAWRFDLANAERALLEHFRTATLAAFGCQDRPPAVRAAGAALGYLYETQRGALGQVTTLSTYATDASMQLDAATRRNLEIATTLRGDGRKGTLLWVLDATLCPMGARRLRAWVDRPLVDRARIERRLDAVEALATRGRLRADARAVLKGLPDIERLINRLVAGYAGPRELLRLAEGLRRIPELRALVAEVGGGSSDVDPAEASRLDAEFLDVDHVADHPSGADLLARQFAQDVADVAEMIADAIADDTPAVLGVPGVIRPGHSADLDAIHASVAEARAWIAGLEARERERTGLRKLKVGYNRVFGYYLELPKSAADAVPPEYFRKQTTTGGERYITPDLKARESELQDADDRIIAAERDIFVALVHAIAARAGEIVDAARDAGTLDALAALAEVAVQQRYTRPRLDDGRAIAIAAGRHPVVERMRPETPFVPNDVAIGPGEIILLTGPNMAGKSTVGRMIAHIVLMAQIGSFVPADGATIGIVDRIFTRIGAQDELAAGQSTFMVEMVETAGILHHATDRSLIVLDELGRGTSTYDGMAIAWAVIEHIHNHPRLGARTLFATHYHELTALADLLPRVRNFNMAVAETPTGIAFLHRVQPGSADRSYGIHVAELAGLPRDVTARAWKILERLEAEGYVPLQRADHRPPATASGQLPLFAPLDTEHPVVESIRRLDVDGMTPLEALTQLYDLRKQVSEKDRG